MSGHPAGIAGLAIPNDAAAVSRGPNALPVDSGNLDRASDILAVLTAAPMGDLSRPALRHQVIEAWLPLCRRLARRYRGRGVPDDDLMQIASVGLIRAVDRYDPGYGNNFTGFAIPTITGEIKRYFRDRTWAVRVPRKLQERHLAITAANSELTQVLRRSPTAADLAAYLGFTEDEVLEGISGARAYGTTSLSSQVGTEGLYEVSDTLGAEDPAFALTDIRIGLASAMAGLSERELRILTMRFYGNLTQLEIARRVGVSQMHISRLLSQSLLKLRGELSHDDF